MQDTQGEIWEQPTLRLPAVREAETKPLLIAFTRYLPALRRRWQFITIKRIDRGRMEDRSWPSAH